MSEYFDTSSSDFSPSCKRCGAQDLRTDYDQGRVVCTSCGLVASDTVLVEETTYSANHATTKQQVGTFIGDAPARSSGVVTSRMQYEAVKSVPDEVWSRRLDEGKVKIIHVCSKLRLSAMISVQAVTYWKAICDSLKQRGAQRQLPNLEEVAHILVKQAALDNHYLLDYKDMNVYDPAKLLKRERRLHNSYPSAFSSVSGNADQRAWKSKVEGYLLLMNRKHKVEAAYTGALQLARAVFSCDWTKCGTSEAVAVALYHAANDSLCQGKLRVTDVIRDMGLMVNPTVVSGAKRKIFELMNEQRIALERKLGGINKIH
ncbi:MAG: TFIIB-type zinc ribbon-containing protein [Fimbriimonadaceae bacterium]